MATPARMPDNALTRELEAASALNRSRGTSITHGADLPAVRSASIGPVAVAETPPLSPEEVTRRNKELVRLGIHPTTGDALTTEDREELMLEYGLDDEVVTTLPPTIIPSRRTARQEIAAGYGHLPDFKNLGTLDLTSGVLTIDGVPFVVDAAELTAQRQWALKIAITAINKHFEQARDALKVGLPQLSLPLE